MNSITVNFHNRTANYGFNVRAIKAGVAQKRLGGHYPCAGSAAAAAVNLMSMLPSPCFIVGPQCVIELIPLAARAK